MWLSGPTERDTVPLSGPTECDTVPLPGPTKRDTVPLPGPTERVATRLLESGRTCITDILHLQLQYRQSPEFPKLWDLVIQGLVPDRIQ